MPWLQVRVLPRQPNMTPYETQTITAIANGPGLHALESLLNECAGVEERAALNCSDEDKAFAVLMRAQGARALANRFLTAMQNIASPQADS
jgi:hypothetical protein